MATTHRCAHKKSQVAANIVGDLPPPLQRWPERDQAGEASLAQERREQTPALQNGREPQQTWQPLT